MPERQQMSWDDFKELHDAYRERYQKGEIDSSEYRRFLGRNGFTATEIEEELRYKG